MTLLEAASSQVIPRRVLSSRCLARKRKYGRERERVFRPSSKLAGTSQSTTPEHAILHENTTSRREAAGSLSTALHYVTSANSLMAWPRVELIGGTPEQGEQGICFCNDIDFTPARPALAARCIVAHSTGGVAVLRRDPAYAFHGARHSVPLSWHGVGCGVEKLKRSSRAEVVFCCPAHMQMTHRPGFMLLASPPNREIRTRFFGAGTWSSAR